MNILAKVAFFAKNFFLVEDSASKLKPLLDEDKRIFLSSNRGYEGGVLYF